MKFLTRLFHKVPVEHNELTEEYNQQNKQALAEQSLLLRQANTKTIELEEELTEASRKATAKIEHLTEINNELKEEKENLLKEIDSLKTQHRKDIITALHEGMYFKNDAALKYSINSFTNSSMPIEDVKLILSEVRRARGIK